jgi:hypothetical protein
VFPGTSSDISYFAYGNAVSYFAYDFAISGGTYSDEPNRRRWSVSEESGDYFFLMSPYEWVPSEDANRIQPPKRRFFK